MITVLLIGDYSDSVIAHGAIPKALALAAQKTPIDVRYDWLATDQITSSDSIVSRNPDAIWCTPGSPYRNMQGALTAIRFARENNIPFLGTCGGFQHALIEYARNVLNLSDADHAESNPDAKLPIVSKLSCALINASETIRVKPNTKLRRLYGTAEIDEPYQCSYGLNPDMLDLLRGIEFTAHSVANDAVRAIELTNHPFFLATLFQPERSALQGAAHPIIVAFLRAAAEHRAQQTR